MIEGRNPVEQYPLVPDFRIPTTSEPNEDEPHVLISLALEDDQRLDLNDWETWLAAFPAIAKYVKVQGVFKSHSTLLLLSLPVMVWDFLPDDPACSFVAFIRSNNLLQAQKSNPETVDSRVPVAGEGPVSAPVRDDAESCLSGTTYQPTESLNIVRRATAGSRVNRTSSTISTPYWDPAADFRPSPHVDRTSSERSSQPSLGSRLRLQSSMASLGGSLRNMPSTTSLGTLERRQLGPPTQSGGTANDFAAPTEGISRRMILNQSRTSKKSVFLSGQDVPRGQEMAPHVIRRLEDYFQKDSDPSIAVVEHLASNLGVETSDVHVSSCSSGTK
jgi:hypothetical protein